MAQQGASAGPAARSRHAALLRVLRAPISSSAVTTVELVKEEEPAEVVELPSSDEDEVIEVVLPPKPTICIESSDEEDVAKIPSPVPKPEVSPKNTEDKNKKTQKKQRREVSASPVPSVVSSLSDDFIRGDCVAFNITRQPEEHSFDYNLHGTDLIDDELNNSLCQKKKRNKKRKDKTPKPTLTTNDAESPVKTSEECFATPKTKAKRKSAKSKKDSSVTKYIVTARSIPDPDIYESDSSQSAVLENNTDTLVEELAFSAKEVSTSLVQTTPTPAIINTTVTPVQPEPVDLTEETIIHELNKIVPIEDNIVMGNVTGFEASHDSYETHPYCDGTPKTLSNKIPPILEHGIKFDVLASVETPGTPKRTRFSKSVIRAEMERFYNESWGGENFNHHEILRQLPRDKKLWAIDPKDRQTSPYRKQNCHYCNQPGHRDDRCRRKPRICHMCSQPGHYEPRCPNRMCMNCGSPNYIYSTRCRNCSNWNRTFCDACRQYGHPILHCPDLWRRYHNTVDNDMPLERQHGEKKREDLYCSGCARQGHLVHVCRNSIPFCNLPIYSPFVYNYSPVYPPTPNDCPPYQLYNKRPEPPKRYFNMTLDSEDQNTFQNFVPRTPNRGQSNLQVTPRNTPNQLETTSATISQKRPSISSNTPETFESKRRSISTSDIQNQSIVSNKDANATPSIPAINKKEDNVLQDNEVSDTSDVITTAKIFISPEVVDKLFTPDGNKWLDEISAKYMLEVKSEGAFIHVKGLMVNQDAFQAELKTWFQPNNENVDEDETTSKDADLSHDIPQRRMRVLRMLTQSLSALQKEIGDPKKLFKELKYLQSNHQKLRKKKVVSPDQLKNSRTKIKNTLKNLNMILLGQAGLANGNSHLSELYSLHDILIKHRKKTISPQMRQRVGEHYHFIFSTVCREDYVELLSKYYQGKQNGKPDFVKIPDNLAKFNKNVNQSPVPAVKINTKMIQLNNEKNVRLKLYLRKLLKVSTYNTVTENSRQMFLKKLRKILDALKKNKPMPCANKRLKTLFWEVDRFLAEL